jgi:hypothetical protein
VDLGEGQSSLLEEFDGPTPQDQQRELLTAQKRMEFMAYLPVGKDNQITTVQCQERSGMAKSSFRRLFKELQGSPGPLRWDAIRKPQTMWQEP